MKNNNNDNNSSSNTTQITTLANGFFWCSEAIFKRLKGVKFVLPGYSGGIVINPSYHCSSLHIHNIHIQRMQCIHKSKISLLSLAFFHPFSIFQSMS